MPHVLNGIGTWYYGKANLTRYRATCVSCGKTGSLSSYDTTKFFVFLMVPIIPLGKLRVINECPHCRAHIAMPLDQWQESRTHALDEARRKLAEGPRDAAQARDALEVFASFQDRDGFLDAARRVSQRFRADAQTMSLVGRLYGEFGMPGEAAETLRQSLRAADTPAAREQLALALIEAGQPSEAAPHLRHITMERRTDKTGYLLMLAQGYQAAGDHPNALQVLREAAFLSPPLAADRAYKKLVAVSEKNLHTRKPVKGAAFSGTGVGAKPGGARRWLPVAIIAGVIGGIVPAMLRDAETGTVWLVNGLAEPYEVKVNGAPYRLAPLRPIEVKVKAAEVRVEASPTTGTALQPVALSLGAPLLQRLFSRETIVVNPDAAAPLLKEKQYYASNLLKIRREPEIHAYIGERLYRFPDVNLPFKEFPKTVQVHLGGTASRTRLTLLEEPEGRSAGDASGIFASGLYTLVFEDKKPEAIRIARRRAEVLPESPRYAPFLRSMMKPAEFVEVAKPFLARRPVLMPWHLAHQDAAMTTEPAAREALEGEYAAALREEPGNPKLQYLASRVARDPAATEQLLRSAATAQPPMREALAGLARIELGTARYADAAQHARTAAAMEQNESRHEADYLLRQSLEGAGRYQEALDMVNAQNAKRKHAMTMADGDETYLLVRLGKRAGAEDLVRRGAVEMAKPKMPVGRLKGKGPDAASLARWAKSTEKSRLADIAYEAGDLQVWLSATADAEYEYECYRRALHLGDLTSASACLEKAMEESDEEDGSADDWLLMYASLSRAGMDDRATTALRESVRWLEMGGIEEQLVAAALASGAAAPDARVMLALPGYPRQKALWLAALAARHPAQRDVYLPLARALNHETRVPHLAIKRVLE